MSLGSSFTKIVKIKCRQNWGVKGGSKKMGDLKRGDHTLAKSFSTSLINFKNSTCSQISQSSFLCVPDQFILNLLSIKILKKIVLAKIAYLHRQFDLLYLKNKNEKLRILQKAMCCASYQCEITHIMYKAKKCNIKVANSIVSRGVGCQSR